MLTGSPTATSWRASSEKMPWENALGGTGVDNGFGVSIFCDVLNLILEQPTSCSAVPNGEVKAVCSARFANRFFIWQFDTSGHGRRQF